MAVDQLLIGLEELNPLLFTVGEFLRLLVDRRDVVLLDHVGVQQRQRILVLQHHRIVLFAQFALKSFTRRHQLIPGFRVFNARFFPGFIVEVEDARGHGDRDPVQLAVHRGGLQLFRIELRQIDHVLHFVQVVEAVAGFGEDRQPVPVGLHHVRLGAARNLRGQTRQVTIPAGVFRFNVNIRVLFVELFQSFQRDLVTAIAAPPGHTQIGAVRSKSG